MNITESKEGLVISIKGLLEIAEQLEEKYGQTLQLDFLRIEILQLTAIATNLKSLELQEKKNTQSPISEIPDLEAIRQ